MNNTTVFRYANEIYDKNQEMLAIYNSQHNELENVNQVQLQAFYNNFVKLCDVEGIRRWEKIFHIIADEVNENLDYRINRVLLKMLKQPPYTEVFLRQLMSGLFGTENYDLQIINNNYIIKLLVQTDNDDLYSEFLSMLYEIKPCNMTVQERQVEKYMHIYLKRNYTHQQMKQFTQGELSQYAEE